LGKERLQATSVFRFQYSPATIGKQTLEMSRTNTRYYTIKALAVEINNPQQIIEFTECRIEHSLPNIPFIKFGITNQSNKALRSGSAK
jgi:hypothetical protein